MSEITEAQVRELLELSGRATPEPWEVETEYMTEPGYEQFIKRQVVTTASELVEEEGEEPYTVKYSIARMDWSSPVAANAELMVLSRNLLPILAQSWLEMAGEVERLRKIETATRALREWEEAPCPYCDSSEHDGAENPPQCTCFDWEELNKELDAALGVRAKEDAHD